MSNLTKIDEVRSRLQDHLDVLHKEAEQNRQLFQIGKAAGFGGFALGAIGCIALPAAGLITLGVGAITYLGTLFSEASVTGEITPIPYVATRLGTIAGAFIQESAGISDDEMEHAEYLPKRDQVFYLMILCQGERIAQMLAQLPENQWMPAIEAVITQNMKLNKQFGFLDAVRDGEGLLNVTEQSLGLKSTAPALPMATKESISLSTVGLQTRLGAVEVPSRETEDDQRPMAVQASDLVATDIRSANSSLPIRGEANLTDSSQWKKQPAIAANPISILGDRLSSLLLIASTGAGKGILISNLIRHFHAKEQSLQVFAFEGKNDPNETGYWADGFEQVARINLDICDAVEAASAIAWIIDQVDQNHQRGTPSILLIDEANTLITVLDNGSKYGSKEDKEFCGTVLGRVKKKISTAASTGNSAQKYVWAIGQNPNLTALGLNGGATNQLRKVAIAFDRYPTLTDQVVLATGYTGKRQDAPYRAMIDDLISASPVDRAFYDSASAQTTEHKGWFAMGKMVNYSGYDRDSRTHLTDPAQAKTTVQPSKTVNTPKLETLKPASASVTPTTQHENEDVWADYQAEVEAVEDPISAMLSSLVPTNPKIEALIAELAKYPPHPRTTQFFGWLRSLKIGQVVGAESDREFVKLAQLKNIINEKGVVQ